jgi:hypothetical protein
VGDDNANAEGFEVYPLDCSEFGSDIRTQQENKCINNACI